MKNIFSYFINKRYPAWVPSILSGFLLALGYPGYGILWIFWLGFLPLCWPLEKQSSKQRFWHGWRSGTVFYLMILPWVLTLWDWAGAFIVLGYLALSAGLGLLWGFWALIAGRWVGQGGLFGALAGAALWSLLEFAKSNGTFGFAWGNLGHTLIGAGPLVQLAAWTGEWGLSLLVVFSGISFFLSIRKRKPVYIWVTLSLIVIVAVLGSLHKMNLDEAIAKSPTIQVALIQPNIPQREKNDPSRFDISTAIYLRLLETLDDVDLVVLPESILPMLLLEDFDTLDQLTRHTQRLDADLMLGSFTRDGLNFFNSTLYFSPEGRLLDQYDKVQLVPFSTEYFPFKEWIQTVGGEWISSLPLGMLSRGTGYHPIALKQTLVGTPICFETSFSRISREFVRKGANLLISTTNDAWFKDSLELEQHWQMGKLRAVETGKAFIQVANTGVTGVALPTGKTALKLMKKHSKTGIFSVPILEEEALYVKWGDWLIWFCSGLVLLIESYFWWTNQKRKKS